MSLHLLLRQTFHFGLVDLQAMLVFEDFATLTDCTCCRFFVTVARCLFVRPVRVLILSPSLAPLGV